MIGTNQAYIFTYVRTFTKQEDIDFYKKLGVMQTANYTLFVDAADNKDPDPFPNPTPSFYLQIYGTERMAPVTNDTPMAFQNVY